MLTKIDDIRLYRPMVFNAVTRARFFRDRRRRWLAHVGRATDAKAVLIDQLCALEWDIRRLETREAQNGKLTAHDRNALAAWRRHFREALRQLGPAAAAQPAEDALAYARRVYGPARGDAAA